MNNVQLATAIHILTMLAITEERLSSAVIAGSINVDAAIVRRSLRLLAAKDLVSTREGKGGGVSLSKPADKIFLSDIYHAVIPTSSSLLGRFNNPDPKCNTGKRINSHLTELYQKAESALIESLGTTTLADFGQKFK